MINYDKTTFQIYQHFKKKFLRRFTDLNSVRSTVKKLMNLKQKKLLIQNYCIKIMNLAELVNLEKQITKTHFF